MRLDIKKFTKEVFFLWSVNKNKRNKILKINFKFDDLKLSEKSLKNDIKLNKKNKYRSSYSRQTSGTTGTPKKIILSRRELGRMLAVRNYCFNHHGIRLGDREARLWSFHSRQNSKEKIKDFMLNRKRFYPSGESAKQQIEMMLCWKPKYIYGYTSLILEAAQIIERFGLKVPFVTCVICTAETILPFQKKYISDIFNAPVIEEYGCTEFDIVAFECTEGHRHLVNPWLIVEENYGRCLITDMSRKSQLFTRYIVGDSIELKEVECSRLGDSTIISKLEGREVNRFAYISSTKKFHSVEFSHAINDYMESHNIIFSFTVVQHDFSFFSIYVDKGLSVEKDGLCKYVEKIILNKTGYVIKVDVDYIRLQNLSNKRSYFLQEMNAIQ
tara:strand:+ start:1371 stop:2525 length:1155 start_codon:yes stop_codon:yes gene_type:complete